eukprot:gnl/TRDRNA2_/TRDRNA2_36520_c0_seq1.p1 gnl/TRDRNA2_/TRDRNA2_36520_c0~~gnl/TRDRNA2_/TRDRNA2_36520_c0_seq1.p1  ORF type:complete len:257 (+),score=44.60 gnl/TRDRNA2_/TRDRNA2_36520_c0_seq1:76-771(+)
MASAAWPVVALVAIFGPIGAAAARVSLRNSPATAVVYRGAFCASGLKPDARSLSPQECRNKCVEDFSCRSYGVWGENHMESCVTFKSVCMPSNGFCGKQIQNTFGGQSAIDGLKKLEVASVKANSTREEPGWRTATDGFAFDRCANLKAMPTTKYAGKEKMTLEVCHGFCLSSKSFYFMLKEGGQCFCSDSYEMVVDSRTPSCDAPCVGDSKQICGGKESVSVYIMGGSCK